MDPITLPARGGPLDGRQATSRFPKGFLLVHKPNGICWIYDATPDCWAARGDAEPWDRARSRTAADGADYDVLALDVP